MISSNLLADTVVKRDLMAWFESMMGAYDIQRKQCTLLAYFTSYNHFEAQKGYWRKRFAESLPFQAIKHIWRNIWRKWG